MRIESDRRGHPRRARPRPPPAPHRDERQLRLPVALLAAVLAELPQAFGCTPSTPSPVLPAARRASSGDRVRRSRHAPHPRLYYVPCRLSLVPQLFHRPLPPDVVLLHTSTPRDGKVSLGVEVNVLPAAIEAARRRGGLVVAQVNPRMPWTYGDAVVDLDVVDLLRRGRRAAADPRRAAPSTTTSAPIGELVAARVGDGATLQPGIGAVPDATLAGLPERRGLRVWTEMFSDGVLALEQAGALDRDVPVTASFLFGSPELLRRGWTATRGCGCCAPRRPTTRR